MVRHALGIAILITTLGLGSQGMAQSRPMRGVEDRADPPRARHIFFSPWGEPFRGGNGLATWFAAADLDHDGQLTKPEAQADAARFFQQLDADGNGVVDGFENGDYERKIAPEINGLSFGGRIEELAESGEPLPEPRGFFGGRKHRNGSQERREGAARFSLLNEPQPVRGADADLDGRVSRLEWRRATDHRVNLLDRDHLGYLTLPALSEIRRGR